MNFPEHVTAQHLALKAIVYIRQSTLHQVMNNQESRQLQQDLRLKAIQCGWPSERVEIIDEDLGVTGTNMTERQGLQRLLGQVAMEEIGIIFSYDVGRLSRNCSDWYPLLDICGYRRTLIGDKDGIYDPRTQNGRLILGLKGQFAEAEGFTIRGRMQEGIINKAKRGDLIKQLPIGLVCYTKGIVTKDPNMAVQNCVNTIFETFMRLKSVSKVLSFFHNNNLKIPRYINKELHWMKPSKTSIMSFLKNPAYSGANVYGKTEIELIDFSTKKKRRKRLPMEQWKYIVKDKFPSYITWECFELIQSILKENYSEYAKRQTKGIPRSGNALLHGLVYCGECGHKMHVHYSSGERYICNSLKRTYAVSSCQHIPINSVDKFVVEAFFQALSPIELDAYENIVKEQWAQTADIDKMKEQQLERLRYYVKLAEKQYNQVDPDNRLVAAELERRWESALKELKEAENEHKTYISEKTNKLPELPNKLKEAFKDIGKKLPEIWNQILLKNKKTFLRCLIDKVVIHRIRRDCLQIRIVWKGGETTTKDVFISVRRFSELLNAKELENKILELAKLNKKDNEIAKCLTEEGYHSATQKVVLPSMVRKIRYKHGFMKRKGNLCRNQMDGFLTISQMAKKVGVASQRIYEWISKGSIQIEKNPMTGCFMFPDTEEIMNSLIKLKKPLSKTSLPEVH